MKNIFKKILPVASIALCGMLLTACGGKKENSTSSANEKQTIEFWTISLQPTFNDYFNGLIDDFEKENKNINVEWKDYPLDTLQNKLLTSIASDQAPDVINLNNELVLQMAGKKALANVDTLFSDEVKDSFVDGIYDSTQIDKGIYGVPWYTGVPIIFMNKTLIEKAGLDAANPPKDMDEYLDWAEQISKKDDIAGITVVPDSKLFAYEGVPIISDDATKAVFNDQAGIEMVDKYKEIIDKGYAPKEILNFDKQVQLMATQDSAMILAGPVFINKIKTTAPDVYNNLACAPMPVGQTGNRISSSMFLSITEKSKHKDAAAKFTEYLTNATNQLSFAKLANTLPSTKESLKDDFFAKSDGTVEGDARVASASGLPEAKEFSINVSDIHTVNVSLKQAMEEALINGDDAKTALDKAAAEVNKALKK